MPKTNRRFLLAASGALLAGLLAGCNELTVRSENSRPPAATSTTRPTPQSTKFTTNTSGHGHGANLLVRNGNESDEEYVVSIENERGETVREHEVDVPAGKREDIADAYPMPERAGTYTTVVENEGETIGERDVELLDYHYVHYVSAEVNGNGVTWSVAVH